MCSNALMFAQRGSAIPDSMSNNFFKEVEYKQKYWDSVGVYTRKGEFKLFNRWRAFWEMRVDTAGNYPYPNLFIEAFNIANEHDKASKKDKFLSMPSWKELGPTANPVDATGINGGVGRANIVRANPNNSQELWVGSAFGGAWKSTNGGNNWTPLYQTDFLSLGVSDIAISKSNTNIIYIATGDNDGAIAGGGTSYSIGILKSTDGGNTWNTTGNIFTLNENRIVARLWVHPDNSDIIVATTNTRNNGSIIKSTDGGNTWKTTFSGYRFSDMEQMPNNPTTLYASTMDGGRIFRTDDMGETWKQIWQIQGGGRTCIEVTPAAPNNLYAMAAIPNTGGFHSLIVSDDKGDTWEQTNVFTTKRQNYFGHYIFQTNNNMGINGTGGQGWYDIAMAVSPTNANTIFIGGVNIWKSTDRGKNFSIAATWNAQQSTNYVHADIHDLVFVGNNLYAAHDGGVDITTNLGTSWQQRYNGMGIAQIYHFHHSKQNPDKLIIGLQDLGTRIKDGTWQYVSGGDGMGCAIDPRDDKRYYSSVYNGDVRRHYDGSGGTNIIDSGYVRKNFGPDQAVFVTPIGISPTGKLYVGYSNIYATKDNGVNWTKQTNYVDSASIRLINVNVSEVDENYVYAHSKTRIIYTNNALGAANWQIRNSPPSGENMSYIKPHPVDPKMFYVTISGYSNKHKLYKYDGEKWINLTGNLPNVPANCIAIQMENGQEKLYVGTDIGVYYGLEQVPIYTKWGTELPNTCVSELEIITYPANNKKLLRAATFGRGVWETELNTCTNIEYFTINIDGKNEICSGDSVRLYVETPNQVDVLWSNGEKGNEIWVKTGGDYYAASNTNSDCLKLSSNTINVILKQTSNLSVFTQGATQMCVGDSVTLTAMSGFVAGTYKWNTGDTGRVLVVREAGNYVCSALNQNNDCFSYSDTINVITFQRPATPSVTYITDKTDNINKFDTLESSEVSAGGKYQWYRNGQTLYSGKDRRYVLARITANIGEYTVRIANEGDCFSNPSEPFNYTSIIDDVEDIINISPIPAFNTINVKLPEQYYGKYVISILDMTGKLVKEYESIYIGAIEIIEVSELPSGTYLLKLVSDKHTINKTFIKSDK